MGTFVVLLGVGAACAVGTYLIPPRIGAAGTAFPRLNRLGGWIFVAAALVILASLLNSADAPSAGRAAGLLLLITSSLLVSITTIVTVVQMRAPGLTFMRLPFLVWAQLGTAFLLLLIFPRLEAAALTALMDRVSGTTFFAAERLAWVPAQADVYVLILPAIGIVTEIIAAHIRKPIWGDRLLVYAVIFLGVTATLVSIHQMLLIAVAATLSPLFQTVTAAILSVPLAVMLIAPVVSLAGGLRRFTLALGGAIAVLPLLAVGGLMGRLEFAIAGMLLALTAGLMHWRVDARAGTAVAASSTHNDFTVAVRPDTGTNNVKLAMWLFLASDAMLFGGLFSVYGLLRVSALDRPPAVSPGPTIANTVLLAVIAVFIARARRKAATGPPLTATRRELSFSAILGAAFVVLKASEYQSKLSFGLGPSTSTFYALYYLLTGLHTLHVLGGAIVVAYLAAAGARSTRGDVPRFANRVAAMAMFWYFVTLVWLVLVVLFYFS